MRKPGTLYVVATPIGNLEDITLRARRVLAEVDFVIAEDTRVARKLLSHFEIQKPLERFDEHVSENRAGAIASKIKAGADAALVTDAGTPNVSDPGWKLVALAVKSGVGVVPIPGPSALTALLSISHFPMGDFIFLGYPPAKKGRKEFFDTIAAERRSVVLYESTHRILKTLRELSLRMPEREAIAAKELTKLHEQVRRGKLVDIAVQLEGSTNDELKGEWVIALARQ